jgi:creatinine amidohydrolase
MEIHNQQHAVIMPDPIILKQTPYKQIRGESYDLAVLPWGATEPHNYHLPYGADIIESEKIAAESARIAATKGAKVVVLPTVPFGVNTGQLDIPLTINMNPSTQMALLRDVAASLQHQGLRKLVILNGHGGNDFRQMIRELRPQFSIFLCTVNWYRSVNLRDYFDQPGDHADEMETSLLLYLAPELVLPLSEAGNGREHKMKISAFREGWAWAPRDWTKVTDDTGTGDPGAATAEKGKRYFSAVTEKVGAFLAELSAANLEAMYES